MSLNAEICSVAYDLLNKTGNCTLENIRKEMENRGIPLGSNNASIRAAMSQLVRKDSNIQRSGRGYFEYIKNKDEKDSFKIAVEKTIEEQEDIMIGIEKLEQQAVEIIREAGTFGWINQTDEEVNRIRKRIKRVTQLYKTLQKEFINNKISVN